VPLWVDKDGAVVTQYTFTDVESIGSSSSTSRAEDAHAGRGHRAAHPRGQGVEVRVDDPPLDDAKTYKLAAADTIGVFQLESGGIRRLLTQLKPSGFPTWSRSSRTGPARSTPSSRTAGRWSRLHPAEARQGADPVSAPRARADPARHLRRHRLPGAGDADRAGARRLLPRRRRQPPPRHGQEEEGGHGARARAVPSRRAHGGHRRRAPRRRSSTSWRRSPPTGSTISTPPTTTSSPTCRRT
jgi:hypothetical protein